MIGQDISGAGQPIGVIGGGAWGTALAQVLARNGHPVALVVRSGAAAAALMKDRNNVARLPGVTLEASITATANAAILADCPIIVIACPAQAVRALMGEIAPRLARGCRAVITAKGIEATSSKLMGEVLEEVCPQVVPLVLSGPSFAIDVARGLPTAVTLAAPDLGEARAVAAVFARPEFRPYVSDDLVGVQVGGAVKNVMAIACGIVAGRGLGDSARAALVARAFAEMSRLGLALGARAETLAGLSGLGDLVLTCSSENSRNYALGLAIGRGGVRSSGVTQEGAFTAGPVVALARRHHVDMPIASAVEAVLDGRLSVDAAIEGLLMRPTRSET